MYLMYVDESGDTGLVNSPTRYFALSGLIVHEARWRELINSLIAFRKVLKSVYGLPIRTEIHASEYVAKRVLTLERHQRLAILRNALDELAKLNYVSITNVIVDKAGKPPGYDVFAAAWGTLFQRFENTLVHGNFPGKHTQDFGTIFTDATNGTRLTRIVRRMAVFNPIPNDGRFGSGSRNIPITKIIEDPHSKDSTESLPIQMSDGVAYFLHQRFSPNVYIARQKAQFYFDRLSPILNKRASRFDELGIVKL